MAIDKTLPNVEQEITIPSEEEQLVEINNAILDVKIFGKNLDGSKSDKKK